MVNKYLSIYVLVVTRSPLPKQDIRLTEVNWWRLVLITLDQTVALVL